MSVDPFDRPLDEWLLAARGPIPMPDDCRLYRPVELPPVLPGAHTPMCDVPPALRGPNWTPSPW
ncbi:MULTISPECIES: hypothetical protein [unclassified Streptomyces]|uniref:hypothetical protein n=1 Tax=unclassified Streptomyces TaxID=2593676 RepID=UPI003416E9AF